MIDIFRLLTMITETLIVDNTSTRKSIFMICRVIQWTKKQGYKADESDFNGK